MKPVFVKIIFPLVFLSLLFQSCETNDMPTPDNTQNNRELWNYAFSTVSYHSMYNQPPAIDNSNYIYVIADVQDGGDIVKLSPAGEEQWLVHENHYPMSRIIYSNNKLFYIKDQALICRSAESGEKIWETEAPGANTCFALKGDKIYTSKFVDEGLFGKHYLVSYTTNGEKVWETRLKYSDTDTVSFPNAISVNGNNIYVGILCETDNSEFAILNFIDQGNSVTKNWSWLAPGSFSVGGGTPRIKEFAFDKNNNLLFGMQNGGVQYIFSVSASGTENWHTQTNLSKIIAGVTVDAEGNCYAAYDHCEKINKDGIVWSSNTVKPDWDYTSLFSKAPVIDDHNNLYYLDLSTMLTAVSAKGDSLWSQYYGCDLCNNEFHNLTINHKGDVIVVSKAGVTAYKGSGTEISGTGWPKVYGNLANTGSK